MYTILPPGVRRARNPAGEASWHRTQKSSVADSSGYYGGAKVWDWGRTANQIIVTMGSLLSFGLKEQADCPSDGRWGPDAEWVAEKENAFCQIRGRLPRRRCYLKHKEDFIARMREDPRQGNSSCRSSEALGI